MGVMFAHFQSAGTCPDDIDLLNKIASGMDRECRCSFSNLPGILSGPGAELGFKLLSASSTVAGLKVILERSMVRGLFVGVGILVVSSWVKTEVKNWFKAVAMSRSLSISLLLTFSGPIVDLDLVFFLM